MNDLSRAQQAYDDMEPEDDDDECRHSWRLLGTDGDGDAYHECRKCGKESN